MDPSFSTERQNKVRQHRSGAHGAGGRCVRREADVLLPILPEEVSAYSRVEVAGHRNGHAVHWAPPRTPRTWASQAAIGACAVPQAGMSREWAFQPGRGDPPALVAAN